MEDADYKGSGGASSVLSMLDVVESDFSRLDAETTAAETQAADEYSAMMAEAEEGKAVQTRDMKAKETRKTEVANDLMAAKTDLKNTNSELMAAMDYYDKLKPQCLDEGISYEDRVARRKAEIESLQEALKILDGTDVVV